LNSADTRLCARLRGVRLERRREASEKRGRERRERKRECERERGWICDVGCASVLVRVKLFLLVFVRTHRLVSEGERERKKEREKERERENPERTRRNEGEGEQERKRGEKERGVARRGRKIGRSTILLVRRRASKQNAWSTSELFPFPSSSPVSFPFAHPLLPSSSLAFPHPSKPSAAAWTAQIITRRRCIFSYSLARTLCTPCRASLRNVRRVTRNYESSETRPFASLNYQRRG